jgi:hypothetical protein
MNTYFLINTITDWNEPPRARHQVTYALAKGHKVVFVARNKTGRKGIATAEIHKNITVITPSYPIDYRLRNRIPLINEQYQHWLFGQLNIIYGEHVVINFDFSAHHIFKYFSRVIYYCNDEFIGNSKYPNFITDLYHRQCENMIISKSIFCVATSAYLKDKLLRRNRNTYEIPLGVTAVSQVLPYHRSEIPGKLTVCLLGVISKRQISFELINELTSTDGIHLLLIGPIEDSFLQKLNNHDKITLTGILQGQKLIDTLSSADIGLALYNLKKVNPGATPSKLWHYLSVGIPVIVSDIPNINVNSFPSKSIYVLHKKEDIRNIILTAYQDNSEELFRTRIEFARANTWEKRMDVFLEIIKHHIKQPE